MRASRDDMPVSIDLEVATVRESEWGDMHASIETYYVEMDGAPLFVGLPDNHCQCPHWGYVLKGRYHISYSDGTKETLEAGDAYYLRPGHTAAVEVGTEFVEFSPLDLHAQTSEVTRRNFAAMMGGAE